jgi:hypothetical protein
VPLATYDGYYEEAREVSLIPEGSRSQPGMLMGVGPGAMQRADFGELLTGEVRRIPLLETV